MPQRAHTLADVVAAARVRRGAVVSVFDRAGRPCQAASDGGHRRPVARFSASQVEALRLVLGADGAGCESLPVIPSLAMIASASPLIGLLCTVLGIIQSFIGLSTTGSGSVAAVAPGVAAALTATAMALAVAIPATFGYNIFANRVNRMEGELEGFGSELIALLVREGRI
jgi:biopolymer transport protein TolQ